ncbi:MULTISPECIES: Bug family tripartite tricarboxylate transporter substrate binding protein [Cupriavidus]|uniref:Tripartite-type tricarboxylate transporter receptor subunit TctC n=1 Tax=Cupriavidus alkaliphilus TaxID=942866 RepID=A0A7W4VE60_9BURK|nr:MULTISPECIES: tripartite tricarboxylate transporter substrate-binding protein [Cupriavidus]MBB3009962.1 tripartite-type tricarboxylate transporter receptor subunit TctC [Cupriavidus alkaliphilus]GLC96676.1 hypothetical protein Tamer19_60850 [Cupriavidus sp. TA19]
MTHPIQHCPRVAHAPYPIQSKRRRRLHVAALGAVAMTLLCGWMPAQATWPERPIKLVTGFTAGGGADGVARAVAEAMTKMLGQPVVVENRPGAGTTVAAGVTARAPADGYTLMLLTTTNTISPAMYKKLSYRADKDFTLIGSVARGPMLIGVSKASGIQSLQQLIALARKDPGKLNYGAGGVGTTPHLAALVLQREAGINLTHIPYKGGSETGAALIGGQIEVQFGTPPAMAPLASRTNVLAVTTAQRTALMPNVPAVAETVKGYDVASWYGIGGPAGLPAEVVTKISGALRAVLRDEQLRKQLATLGLEPYSTSPVETQHLYMSELRRWSDIIHKEKLRAED